jgi:hypothetical protein
MCCWRRLQRPERRRRTRCCWPSCWAILMNLLFSIAKAEPVTAAGMQELIERADRGKMRRALEKLGETRLTVPSEAEPVEEIEP